MLKLHNSFPPAVTHSLCYWNYRWRRDFANIQVGGRNYCKLLSCNENGEEVFPDSFIFFPVKFANVFLQSMFQNKPQMFWRAGSHPQSSPASYLLLQVSLSGVAVLLQC